MENNNLVIEKTSTPPVSAPPVPVGQIVPKSKVIKQGEEIIYKNATQLRATKEEQEALLKPFGNDQIDIRPDGLVFIPQAFYRDRLNQVFGIGQWGLIIHRDVKQENKIFIDGSLYIRGSFIARAMGEAEYHESNPQESWGTAWESAKSNCMMRCCKDLSIGMDLWTPRFVEKWIKGNAVKVWNDKKKKYHWRHKNADPFWWEKDNQKSNPPAQKQAPVQKTAPAPLNVDWVKKMDSCKTIDELKEIWGQIPSDRKQKGTPELIKKEEMKLRLSRGNGKDEIEKRISKAEEVLKKSVKTSPELPEQKDLDELDYCDKVSEKINSMDESWTKEQLKEMDEMIDNIQTSEYKQDKLRQYTNKLKQVRIDHTPDVLPF